LLNDNGISIDWGALAFDNLGSQFGQGFSLELLGLSDIFGYNENTDPIQVTQLDPLEYYIEFSLTHGFILVPYDPEKEAQQMQKQMEREEARAKREAARDEVILKGLEMGLAVAAERYIGPWGAIAVHEIFDLVFPREAEGEQEKGRERKGGGGESW